MDEKTGRGEVANERKGLSRRGFLGITIAGAAGAIGLGSWLRRRSADKKDNPLGLEEDSIFWPRQDQLDRFLKKR